MYCEKQGLRHFKTEFYEHENGARDDYAGKPRPCHNLALILDGSVDFEENGKVITVNGGECAFIPKNSEYRSHWYGASPIKFVTVHFDFDWRSDPLKDKIIPVQKVKCPVSPKEKMTYLYEHQDDGTFLFNSMFYSFCDDALSPLEYTSVAKHSTIQPALDFIEANFDKKMSVKYLASLCYLSEAYFYTCFKNETGTSPIDYKNRLCIRHAMHTLVAEPGKSVEKIANDYGFESAVYFRRMFKSVTGKTPNEYRRSEMLI